MSAAREAEEQRQERLAAARRDAARLTVARLAKQRQDRQDRFQRLEGAR